MVTQGYLRISLILESQALTDIIKKKIPDKRIKSFPDKMWYLLRTTSPGSLSPVTTDIE